MIRFYPVLRYFSRQPLHFLILLFLLAGFDASASNRLHMLPLSLEERVKAAELIVEGEVVAQRSFWDADRHNIYTASTIRVYKLFKGALQPQQFELITEGGTVDLEKHVFSGALQLQRGQQGIFFVIKEQRFSSVPGNGGFTGRAYGGKQGLIRYDLQQLTAADVFDSYDDVPGLYRALTDRTGSNFRTITNNLPLQESMGREARIVFNELPLVIVNFSPTTASAGTSTILTINGSGFGATQGNGVVKFRNGDDGGQTQVEPYSSDYKLWTDTRIQVQIPSQTIQGGPAGTGRIEVIASDGRKATSSSNITIEYVYTNVTEENSTTPAAPILINKNNAGGYSIRFAPSMQSRPLAQEGFKRAMNTWICNTQVNWRIGSPTTINKATKDSVNVILFTQLPEKTLAQTISRYSGCRNNVTKQVTWWVDEFDMEITTNPNISWQFGPGPPTGSQFDFETVILHELGHAHQLGHVIQPSTSVMHYAVSNRSLFRTLNPADITGGNRVMEKSFDPVVLAQATLCPRVTPTTRSSEYSIVSGFLNAAGEVEVSWTTCREQQIAGFTVERSENGTEWAEIGTATPKGPGTYTFTDPDPLPGISYYRIRVNHSNTGTPSYSTRVRIVSEELLDTFTLYPNPTNPYTEVVMLEYFAKQDAPVTLQLYDYTGKLVKELEYTFIDENTPFALKVNDLAAGIYILRWNAGRSKKGEVKLLKL